MAGAKSESAFRALLAAQAGTLRKVAWIYCADAEERRDLIQEMSLQLWRAQGRFDGRSSPATWAWRVAVNVAISHRRREIRRLRTAPLEATLRVADDAGRDSPDAMTHALRRLIDGLDEMSRALTLLYLEGFDHAEIAQVLGVTPGAVATRLGRIKARLQSHAAESAPGGRLKGETA